MSPHQIIAVAVRLFAVWLVAVAVMNVPYFYGIENRLIDPETTWVFWPVFFLVLVLALVLWKFPLTIAGKLLSSPTQEETEKGLPDLWLAMGCALMGLYLLSITIPTLTAGLIRNRETFLGHAGDNMQYWLGYELIKILIGLWLVIGARGFRKIFWWARSAGR